MLSPLALFYPFSFPPSLPPLILIFSSPPPKFLIHRLPKR